MKHSCGTETERKVFTTFEYDYCPKCKMEVKEEVKENSETELYMMGLYEQITGRRMSDDQLKIYNQIILLQK